MKQTVTNFQEATDVIEELINDCREEILLPDYVTYDYTLQNKNTVLDIKFRYFLFDWMNIHFLMRIDSTLSKAGLFHLKATVDFHEFSNFGFSEVIIEKILSVLNASHVFLPYLEYNMPHHLIMTVEEISFNDLYEEKNDCVKDPKHIFFPFIKTAVIMNKLINRIPWIWLEPFSENTEYLIMNELEKITVNIF